MDIPRIFNITESAHRIHNPITPEKLATLGAALRLESGARVLDLGSGSGEMLCTWARDHGIIGTGIDMSQLFTEQAKLRAVELGVAEQVKFIHGDAAGIGHAHGARGLIERFARGIVTRFSEDAELCVVRHFDNVRVATGDDKAQERRLEFRVRDVV